jgi:hypothetical protein
VQAWSKNGIDRVEFAISGAGYTGTNPLVANSRSYNPDSGVYDEFFITVDPDDFADDGAFTITPTAFGRDGGSRNIGPYTMNIDHAGTLERHEAWVEKPVNGGSNATGVVDDQNHPFATIPAAIEAIYLAYGDRCDGGIVWVGAGNWTADAAVSNTTTNEWLTISANPAVDKEDVVFNNYHALGASVDTACLHLKGISIGRTSSTINEYTLSSSIATTVWVDGCLVTGNGVTYKGGDFTNGHLFIDPIAKRNASLYSTNSEYTNSYGAMKHPALSVNDYIHDICEDAYQLGLAVFQPTVDNLDPRTFTDPEGRHPHADVFQMHAQGNQDNPDNVILYGFKATNLHYQGFFWRPTSESGKRAINIAVVNNYLIISGGYFTQFEGVYDHILLWNNTFTGAARTSFYQDVKTREFGVTNSSLVGNYFYALEVSAGGTSGYSTIFEAGNSDNNEALSNHYYFSKQDGFGSINNTGSPDTGANTATVGTEEIDSIGRPESASSVLIDRLSYNRTSVDAFGNPRDSVSDVGAWEYVE